jgi:transglutaminase-like putative cysteine protease
MTETITARPNMRAIPHQSLPCIRQVSEFGKYGPGPAFRELVSEAEDLLFLECVVNAWYCIDVGAPSSFGTGYGDCEDFTSKGSL